MTILVSGASGTLGRLILDNLIARGTPVSELAAGARDLRRIADLRDRGIRAVQLDYDDPATLHAGLEGIDRFVMVSVSQPRTPLTQHDAVVEAAAAAGVKALAYTSVYHADTSRLPLAPIHLAAERAIAASGVPAVILRNNAYLEMFLGAAVQGARHGVITAGAGTGRIAGATRPDYAAAAAAAISDENYLGRTLELSGDTSFTYDDLAVATASVSGRPVQYRSLPQDEYAAALSSTGLDARTVQVLTQMDAAIAAGDMDSDDRTLSQLIGRPTTSLVDALRSAF